MTTSIRLAAVLLALLLAVSACVQVEVDEELGSPEDVLGEGEPAGEPQVEPPAQGEDLEVPLDIVEGPQGNVLAFIPVEIHGSGPYSFALDTGASSSVIDATIAEDLGLEVVGTAQGVTGVTGTATADQVQVDDWGMNGVDLGARPLLALDLGHGPDGPLQGLLGSDVLNEFGAITVDYESGLLRLRPTDG